MELDLSPYGKGRIAYLEQFHKKYLFRLLKTHKLLEHLKQIERKALEVEMQYRDLPPGGASEVAFETVVSPVTDEDDEEYSVEETALLKKLWEENFPGTDLYDYTYLQNDLD